MQPPRSPYGPQQPQPNDQLTELIAALMQSQQQRAAAEQALIPLESKMRLSYNPPRTGRGGFSALGGSLAGLMWRKKHGDEYAQVQNDYARANSEYEMYQKMYEDAQRQLQKIAEEERANKEWERRQRWQMENAPKTPDEYAKREAAADRYGLTGPQRQRFILENDMDLPKEDKPEVPGFDEEKGVRTEFMNLTKDFASQTDSFGRVQASVENPSAAGDLALIFNYMKILDPGSTVREGEFATAQNSGSIPDRIRAMYNNLIEGERLSDDQRVDFYNRSIKLYEKAVGLYEGRRQQYHDLARRYGMDPNKIFIERQVLPTGDPMSLDMPPPPPGTQVRQR